MRKPLSILFLSGLLGSLAPAVQSAPQILGLVASAAPVPLVCRGDTCLAELTAFCLQEWRPTPDIGTIYRPTGGDGVTLVAHRADGTVTTFNANALLKFVTDGGHSSVRVNLPRSMLDEGGFTAASIKVGKLVSLLPEPVADDPDPQTELDINIAIGPLREVAASILHEGDERVAAAGVVNRVISLLPDAEQDTLAQIDGGWKKLAAGLPQLGEDATGVALAERAYASCIAETGAAHMNHDYRLMRMTFCLSSRHDVFIQPLAKKYWATVDVGS